MNDITGEFMLVTPDKDNYPIVKLNVDGVDKTLKVHRLCCEAFNKNPFDLPEVDHIDRNHWNPDKNNLEFVTGKENHERLQKSREIEKLQLANYNSGNKHYTNKYTYLQILQVCLRLVKHEKVSIISRKTHVDIRTVYLIKSGSIWKNVSCYFSFNRDGFINEYVLDKIESLIQRGISNESILNILKFPYTEYFINIINDIRLLITKNEERSTTRES